MILVVLAAGPTACSTEPAGPQPGEVVPDIRLEGVQREIVVSVTMPGFAYSLDHLAVSDEVMGSDGEMLGAPEDHVFVTYSTSEAGRPPGPSPDEATDVVLVGGGVETRLDLVAEGRGAVLLPGDGADIRLVTTSDGRVLVYDVVGERWEPDSPEQYVSMRTGIGSPTTSELHGVDPAWQVRRPNHAAEVTGTTWLPELGWAGPGHAWAVVEVTNPATLDASKPLGEYAEAEPEVVDIEAALVVGDIRTELDVSRPEPHYWLVTNDPVEVPLDEQLALELAFDLDGTLPATADTASQALDGAEAVLVYADVQLRSPRL